MIKINILYKNSHYNKFDIIDSIDDEKNANFTKNKINVTIFDLIENIINFTDKIKK